jgi:hypothetical protein
MTHPATKSSLATRCHSFTKHHYYFVIYRWSLTKSDPTYLPETILRPVNECKQYMFFLHSQLLYFLIIFFSQHVSASMGHPHLRMLWEEYDKKIQQLRVQEKHILFTFIYMYATQQDAPHRNEVYIATWWFRESPQEFRILLPAVPFSSLPFDSLNLLEKCIGNGILSISTLNVSSILLPFTRCQYICFPSSEL